MRKKMLRAILALSVVAAVGVSSITYVNASEIEQLEEEKKEAESKKAEAQGILDQLTAEQADIISAIKELDAKVEDYTNQIVDLEAKKVDLEADIEVTKEDLAVAQADEQAQYDAMKLHIQYSYENGDVEYMDTLFTSAEMADMVNQSEYAEQIYKYDSNMLSDLIEVRKLVADTQLKLESELAAVEVVETELNDSKDALQVMIDGKQKQVDNYGNSMDEYEDLVAKYQADIEATDAAIAEAERKEQERLAALAAAGGGGGQVYYTGGALGWPVPGNYTYISSYFGPRSLLGMSFHHGVDIPCPTGTPIYAAEAGTVITAGWSYSLGNYVVIDHGGGMTTVYGHNSAFAVSYGTVVAKGQVIAYAGSTGQSTAPHCHIAVRINGSYVDPLPYL
ncbi:MAG: peptidoglycan DD-metalloendopeptidase family protein [Clostridium sp.]|nr:peptidoglycan DD-metalloendopeptidase family protein [Clostridium sp.]